MPNSLFQFNQQAAGEPALTLANFGYAFWKDADDARVVEVGMRETQVDVSGQRPGRSNPRRAFFVSEITAFRPATPANTTPTSSLLKPARLDRFETGRSTTATPLAAPKPPTATDKSLSRSGWVECRLKIRQTRRLGLPRYASILMLSSQVDRIKIRCSESR